MTLKTKIPNHDLADVEKEAIKLRKMIKANQDMLDVASRLRANYQKARDLRRELREKILVQYEKVASYDLNPYKIAKLVGEEHERTIYRLNKKLKEINET